MKFAWLDQVLNGCVFSIRDSNFVAHAQTVLKSWDFQEILLNLSSNVSTYYISKQMSLSDQFLNLFIFYALRPTKLVFKVFKSWPINSNLRISIASNGSKPPRRRSTIHGLSSLVYLIREAHVFTSTENCIRSFKRWSSLLIGWMT